MGGCKCTFRDCPNTTANSPGTHFFHYPLKDHERCLKWVKNANTKDFLDLPFSKARNKVVCETHFRDDCFMNYKKERLVHTAVPTLVRIDSEFCLDYEESDNPSPKLISPPSQTHLIPPTPTEKIKDAKPQQPEQQQSIESDEVFVFDTIINSAADTYQETSITNAGPSTRSNLRKKNNPQQAPPKILNSGFVKNSFKNHAVYIRENSKADINIVLNEEIDLDEENPISIIDGIERVQNNCSEEDDEEEEEVREEYLVEEIQNKDFHAIKDKTITSNQIVNKTNLRKRHFQEDTNVNNSKNNQTTDPVVSKKQYGGKNNKITTNKVHEVTIQKISNILSKAAQNNKNISTGKSESNMNAEKTVIEFDYFEKRIKELEEELEKEKNKNKIKENSQAQVGTISTSRQQSNTSSTLQPTKAQLFNGIKKYLSPSMTTLVRMEMFGGPDREWKTDEKQVSIELLRLGDDVFKYLRDEWRFRLPPIKSVEKWLNEFNNEENEEDL